MNHHRPHQRLGFTLVELLTVIAIIGILAAITIPIVSGVRASAQNSRCLNNLRQLGMAITLYAQNEGGRFPYAYRSGGSNTDNFWHRAITPYLDDSRPPDLFFCARESIEPNDTNATNQTNYISNRRLFNDGQYQSDGTMPDRVPTRSVPRPAQVGLLFDGAVNALGYSHHSAFAQIGQNSTSPASANNPVPNMESTSTSNAIISWRHGNRTNVVFVDGHVETVPLGELRYRNLQIAY